MTMPPVSCRIEHRLEMQMQRCRVASALVLMAVLWGCEEGPSSHQQAQASAQGGVPDQAAEAADPPEVAIGERLFLETRFAQFFAATAEGINTPLERGDPALEKTEGLASTRGAFSGQSMNCRAC